MRRQPLSLDQPRPSGDEAGGEIVALGEDRAASSLKHDLAHRLGDGEIDSLLDQSQRDGIEISALWWRSIRYLPKAVHFCPESYWSG